MRKFLSFSLILAMLFSMSGCGCSHQWEEATCLAPKTCSQCGETEGEVADHTPGELTVAEVNTEALTITHNLPCSVCGTVLETKESATGIAPVNSLLQLSADEWFSCLVTNIHKFGATQTLVPHGAESQDNALVLGVVSFAGLKAAITFKDAEGNTLLADQNEQRDLIHSIQIDAHFTNDTAKEFYMLLMLTMITNNTALELDAANTMCGQIMNGNPATDNGYDYQMAITSVENQTVRVEIIAK